MGKRRVPRGVRTALWKRSRPPQAGDRLAVDVPVLLPGFGGDLIKQCGLADQRAELAAEPEAVEHLLDGTHLTALHQRVGVLLAPTGQMQIHHGGFQLRMAEVLLDHPEVDPGLEQMGGIRMPEHIETSRFWMPASPLA